MALDDFPHKPNSGDYECILNDKSASVRVGGTVYKIPLECDAFFSSKIFKTEDDKYIGIVVGPANTEYFLVAPTWEACIISIIEFCKLMLGRA